MSTWRIRAGELLGAQVREARRLAGGDLSAVYRAKLSDGRCIIAKLSEDAVVEAGMLDALGSTGIPVPEVMAAEPGLLLMEALPSSGRVGSAWDSLAALLRDRQSSPDEHYGWRSDYAFGPVPIANGRTEDWPTFWAERRLLCHADHVSSDLARRLERCATRLPDMLPSHPQPVLLHGDLWGGNILVDGHEISGLIDPACYYGHGEVDVAMLTLFDHPPQTFFELLELAPGWRDRLPVYRLWPLLVHLRLFGNSYRSGVEAALSELGC